MTKFISAVNNVWYHDDELAKMCSNLVESCAGAFVFENCHIRFQLFHI